MSVDREGGTIRHGLLTLVIPEGALDEPTTITVEEIDPAQRGAVVPAYELGPDGLEFKKPVELYISYEGLVLPPGTDASRLEISLLDHGHWVALADQENDSSRKQVVAGLQHFSTYSLVPEPSVTTGVGTHLELNGILVDASAPFYGRLFVSPYYLSLYVENAGDENVTATFSGLPTDEPNYAYIGTYGNESVLTPADGGRMAFNLDLREPAFIWFQPGRGTTFIGGGVDQCESVGVRVGDVCTLTTDVVGSVELLSGTLDCDGHSILQEADHLREGTGIFVGSNAVNPEIRNCTIGGPGAYFGNGIQAIRTDGLMAVDNRTLDNDVGIVLQSSSGSSVSSNTVTGRSYWAIALWDASSGNEVGLNSVAVAQDGITIAGVVGAPDSNNIIRDNVILGGTGGFLLKNAQGNEISGNDRDGGVTGLAIFAGGWPNRVYWNNFEGLTEFRVLVAPDFPFIPINISYDGKGNWWGHPCPGPLFTPGVDSSRADVTDSFAYGFRDAWLIGAEPGCLPEDTTPPEPPVIRLPAEGNVVFTSTPTIIGAAEASASVTIYEAGTVLGTGVVSAEGEFGVMISSPLTAGTHTVQARATDTAGNASALSTPRTFAVRDVSEASPLVGIAGRFRVVELADFPDAFEPGDGPNHLRVVAKVKPVTGLGGNSRNHRFLAVVQRTLRHPETGANVKTTLGFAEVPNLAGAGGVPVTAIIADDWCGTDSTGMPVERGLTYPYDLSVQILRQYVGPGQGPRCSRGETPLITGTGSHACLVDSLQAANIGVVSVAGVPGGEEPKRPYCYPDLLMLTDKARTMAIPELVYPRWYFTRAVSRVWGEDFSITPTVVGCDLDTAEVRAACILSRTSAFGIDNPDAQLRHIRTDRTNIGESIVRFQQILQNWDVYGSQVLVVEAGDGRVTDIFSHFIPDLRVVNSATGNFEADFAAFDESMARHHIEEELRRLGEPTDPHPVIQFEGGLIYVDHAAANPEGRLAVRAMVTPASGPHAMRAFILDVFDARVLESRLIYPSFDRVTIDTQLAYPIISDMGCTRTADCPAPYDYCYFDFFGGKRCVDGCTTNEECASFGTSWECYLAMAASHICKTSEHGDALRIYTDRWISPDYEAFMPYRRMVEAVEATADFFDYDLGRLGWTDSPSQPLAFHTFIYSGYSGASGLSPWVAITFGVVSPDDNLVSSVRRYQTIGHEWTHKMIQCITDGPLMEPDCSRGEVLYDGHDCLGEGITDLYGALLAVKHFGGSETRWLEERACITAETSTGTGLAVWESPWGDATNGLERCRDLLPYALRSRFDCSDCRAESLETYGVPCSTNGDCLPYEYCSLERSTSTHRCSSSPSAEHCNQIWNRFARILAEGSDTFTIDGNGEDIGLDFAGLGYDRTVDVIYSATQRLTPSTMIFDWVDSLSSAGFSYGSAELGIVRNALGAVGFINIYNPALRHPLVMASYLSDRTPSATRFNAWTLDENKTFWAWRDPESQRVKVAYVALDRPHVDTIATTDYRPVLIEYNDILHVFWVKDGHVRMTYYTASGNMSPVTYDLGDRMGLVINGELDAVIFQGSLYLVFTKGYYKQVALARCIAPPGQACTSADPISYRWYDFSGSWYTTVRDASMFKSQIAAAAVSGLNGTASPDIEYLYVAGTSSAVANENQIRVVQIDSGHRMIHIENVPDHYPSYRTLGSIGLHASRSAFGDRNYLYLAWADSVSSEVYMSIIQTWDDVDGSDTWFTRSAPMDEFVLDGVSFIRGYPVDDPTASLVIAWEPNGFQWRFDLYGRY